MVYGPKFMVHVVLTELVAIRQQKLVATTLFLGSLTLEVCTTKTPNFGPNCMSV